MSHLAETRIGEDYGFAGAVYRVTATTKDGLVRLVVKVEDPEQVERTVTAYRHIGGALAGRVPALLGHSGDTILFEDIAKATQGDALTGATREQTLDLVDLVADLHAATWDGPSDDFSPPSHWEPERWDARIRVAGERYPNQLTEPLKDRLRALHDEIPSAMATIGVGPLCWTHGDVHLDNVLWRPDGSAVLLDWANAAIRNPAADVVPLLEFSPVAVLTPGEALGAYLVALKDHGIHWPGATRAVLAAARLHVRGLVGFAGYPEGPTQPRLLAFRDTALGYAGRALAWIDETKGRF